jgi:hypothetical protein
MRWCSRRFAADISGLAGTLDAVWLGPGPNAVEQPDRMPANSTSAKSTGVVRRVCATELDVVRNPPIPVTVLPRDREFFGARPRISRPPHAGQHPIMSCQGLLNVIPADFRRFPAGSSPPRLTLNLGR